MKYSKSEIEKLKSKFGMPLYVFDENAFVENYKHFNDCFRSVYPNYQLSYSYKTNYAPYICRIVKKLGGYAEVVSDMELEIAYGIGYKPWEVIYNGPSKGPLAEQHLLNQGILNVDNIEELNNICKLAETNPNKKIKIGLRVNIDIGQNFVSRFGIDENQLDEAFNKVKGVKNLSICGLHCHIGRSRSIDAWRNRANKMIAIADAYFENPPEYISLGSGMFGEMEEELAVQFSPNIPSFEEYAEASARQFAEHYIGGKQPVLLTEPGTTIVNKYIDFVVTVESIKHIKGHTFVVLGGSKHNLGEICEIKKLPIIIISSGGTKQYITDADFVGYTCLEHDVLYKGYSGDLAVGDYVVFGNVGGYSNVSKPPFIRPNCAMISSSGNIIKKAETVREIIETYE